MKNAMVIPTVTVTFYLFGWWIYSAIVNGPGITGGMVPPYAEPWNELMAPTCGGKPVKANLTAADTALWPRLNGVFFGAFLLFSFTTASIVSGAIIERVQSGAFWIVAVMLGSVSWIIDASWGWHPLGWMVKLRGYHDAYASGVVHAIAGGTALAVLINLGPRIGKFPPDGTPRNIPPQNPWLVCIGLFLIYTGFWGFYAACNIPLISPHVQAGSRRVLVGDDDLPDGDHALGDHLQLPDVALRRPDGWLHRLEGGSFWTFSGGLCGIIACSAGNDLYHPIQAMMIAAIVAIIYKLHYLVERRFKIDDAVGAVAVHGYGGSLGVIVVGFVLWGTPSSPYEGFAQVNPLGNFAGACLMFGLGFIPIYIVCKILDSFGLLRVPAKVELEGVDFALNRTFMGSVREVGDAEKAMIK